MLKAIVKKPNEEMQVIEIEDTLESLQNAVDGSIEYVQGLSDKTHMYVNDEGKILGMDINFFHPLISDMICGPAVVLRDDDEGGEASITEEDELFYRDFFKERKEEALKADKEIARAIILGIFGGKL